MRVLVRRASFRRQPVTLRVNGGSELSLRLSPIGGDSGVPDGDSPSGPGPSGLRLGNVRIVVEEGGKLTVGMAADIGGEGVCVGSGSPAAGGERISSLTLEGATAQVWV